MTQIDVSALERILDGTERVRDQLTGIHGEVLELGETMERKPGLEEQAAFVKKKSANLEHSLRELDRLARILEGIARETQRTESRLVFRANHSACGLTTALTLPEIVISDAERETYGALFHSD